MIRPFVNYVFPNGKVTKICINFLPKSGDRINSMYKIRKVVPYGEEGNPKTGELPILIYLDFIIPQLEDMSQERL